MSLPPVEIPESALTYLPELSCPPGGPLPAGLASTRVRFHDLLAHKEAIRGPALDPLHLLLRSTFPDVALRHRIPEEVAVVLKAEHDLAFCSQLGTMDSASRKVLLEDFDALGEHPPDNATLAVAWGQVRMAIADRVQMLAQAA
ncbi:MAG: hypothetical protein ACI9VR_003331 [Cognaticolwellia sp.]|jgi:hypothetical protein